MEGILVVWIAFPVFRADAKRGKLDAARDMVEMCNVAFEKAGAGALVNERCWDK